MSINAPESGPPEIRSYLRFFLSGWGDLNSRPSVPQTGAEAKDATLNGPPPATFRANIYGDADPLQAGEAGEKVGALLWSR